MAIEKVREYFKTLGIEDRIKEFDVSSATVELAAEAVTAGDTKIKNQKFKQKFGFKAKMLTPDEVIEYTGHAIGGVCAFAIERDDVDVYADESMKRFETIFPACGSSNSAIEFTCDELFEVSKAKEWIDVCDIAE